MPPTADRTPRKGLRRRLTRWLRPPRILRPTRAGWCFFAITACVAFAALNTGNNLLYRVLSLMLAFLVLSGVLSESALRGIEVRRSEPGELFAGAEGSVIVDEVRSSPKARGWDAKERKFVNMYDAGIIDPAKVVRAGLQNAASIAGMILTTETLITDLKDEESVAEGAEI